MVTQAATISLSHHEPLQRLSISGASVDGSQKIAATVPVEMSFDALGRSFELELSPNARLLDAARNVAGNAVTPYRGKLAGNDSSWVRIVIADGAPAGLIWDGNELFAIERPGENVIGSESTIIYRLADAFIESGTMTCGTGDEFTTAAAVYKSLIAELRATAAPAQAADMQIEVAVVADFEFFEIYGQSSSSEIVTRMNNVDGVFSQDLGVQIKVSIIQPFPNADDPFSDTTDPTTLLNELSTYRSGNNTHRDAGLSHLWTGRDLDGSTVGIAFRGTYEAGSGGFLALCSTNGGAGLSQGTNGSTFDGMIAAHEIGHNFGAPHDGESGSACESEAGNFLMATSLSNATMNRFSPCSIGQMSDDIAQASCITPLPSVDMSFGLGDPAPAVLLGNTATVTFDVINAGTLPASNVMADFTLPANVSLLSAAASMGSCTDGAGTVSCAIGEVQGTTTITVTLTSDTVAVGSGTFNASVSADIDDDSTNNLSSLTLTVDPAVNLSVTPPSTRELAVDRSTGLTALLENTSILDATGVTLTITWSSGLRVNSASWPLGACTVASTRVDCNGANFPALSNLTLSLGITALTEGSKTIRFSMSSAEDEADPSNNTASATLNVTPPQEESGGGGASLWLLPLLGLLAFRRRALLPG